MNYNIIIIR